MPSWHLNWHYRSRDEALISFSNHHIYQDRLVTFPGPGQSTVIRHVLAEQPLGIDGQEESCSEEVNKVVDLVLEHAEKRPSESLGVIAMGIRHADRVQRAIDQALTQRPELGQFFDVNSDERFFVKNLERVQGDERDAIILTIGYGKDRGGNLPFQIRSSFVSWRPETAQCRRDACSKSSDFGLLVQPSRYGSIEGQIRDWCRVAP